MPAPASPRILALANQKGGEGKTTTAVNLAASLAAAERRVLLIDLDPQGNASSGVGVDRQEIRCGTYELLIGEAPLTDCIQGTELPFLTVVPASVDLVGAELELVGMEGREDRLADALRTLPSPPPDFVILDCPPSLGLLTLNALVAADAVLVPMQAKYFSLEGLGALNSTIERVRETLNPRIELEGIVFCMLDRKTNLATQVMTEVRTHFPDKVYETTIPQNVRLSESPSFGKPALLYDIESKGAVAYLELASEFLSRMNR